MPRVFFVGLLNTLLVSVIGIFFATVIGFLVALGRLSPNWLLSRISGGYVEGSAICRCCSRSCSGIWRCSPRCRRRGKASRCSDWSFFPTAAWWFRRPIGNPGLEAVPARHLWWRSSLRSAAAALCAPATVRQRQADRRSGPMCWVCLIGLPLVAALDFRLRRVSFEIPVLKGFNFAGGSRIIPEFVALRWRFRPIRAPSSPRSCAPAFSRCTRDRWKPAPRSGYRAVRPCG